MPVVYILLFIVLVAVVGYVAWQYEKKKRAERVAFAAKMGWHYSHEKDRSVAQGFSFLNRLRRGSDRYAKDVFRGTWRDYPMFAFNYHYETYSTDSDGNRDTKHHWLGVFALQIVGGQTSFPELTIGPENMLKRLGHAITGSDIDFESIEFSRRFEVKAKSKRFAYDFCNPAMMEYLLASPRHALELEGQWMAIVSNGKLSIEEITPTLDHLCNIRQRMPTFMFGE